MNGWIYCILFSLPSTHPCISFFASSSSSPLSVLRICLTHDAFCAPLPPPAQKASVLTLMEVRESEISKQEEEEEEEEKSFRYMAFLPVSTTYVTCTRFVVSVMCIAWYRTVSAFCTSTCYAATVRGVGEGYGIMQLRFIIQDGVMSSPVSSSSSPVFLLP